jgi:antibiotic biosynthesis monooxygenase (ABM) superfamily enzyme
MGEDVENARQEDQMSQSHAQTQRAPAPPRYKMALITWVGAYSLITTILALLGPMMATWPLALKTLPLSVLMVIAMTWVVVPALTRLFRSWLAPAAPRSARELSPQPRRGSAAQLQPGLGNC